MDNKEALLWFKEYSRIDGHSPNHKPSLCAINALEKQIPYKPEEYEDKYYGCKCGEVLLEKWEKYPTKLMSKSWGLPYCMGCGQKLDWS